MTSHVSKQVIGLCYSYQFKSADSVLKKHSAENPSNPSLEYFLLETNLIWWKIISGETDPALKKRYYQGLNRMEKALKEMDSSDPTIGFLFISMYAFQARMELLEKNYVKGFFRMNNCLKLIERTFGSENQNPFYLLSSGLYYYYVKATYDNYPWTRPYLFLYPSGDKAKGISFLEKAANHANPYLSTEANYFLMKIYMDEKKYSQASVFAEELAKKHPENGLYMYYSFNVLLKKGKSIEAWNALQEMAISLSKNRQISAQQAKHFRDLAFQDWDNYQDKTRNQIPIKK